MTLADLIASVRVLANDKVEPHFWSDEEITDWLNEAVDEAAVRGRLIHESALPDVCQIVVSEGVAVYPLHPALYELDNIGFQLHQGHEHRHVALKSAIELDKITPKWRERTGMPMYAIQSDTSVRLVPMPAYDGTLWLEGFRLPIERMTLADKDTAAPEIQAAHHPHLIQWALHRGFSVPDAESFDPERSMRAEQEFTKYFGLRPSSDLRRSTRADVPHQVEAFMP